MVLPLLAMCDTSKCQVFQQARLHDLGFYATDTCVWGVQYLICSLTFSKHVLETIKQESLFNKMTFSY